MLEKIWSMRKSIASPEHQALCELLKQVRRGAGLSQVDLAERLGEPQSFVSRYETGQQRLDVLELRQVCLALGISLTEFAERLERLLGDS
jgi:transcriptional regulator with XRE-family HTH domain